MAKMVTLTVKIPAQLEAELQQVAQRSQLSKSEVVRRALASYSPRQLDTGFVSALTSAGDLVGCFSGGPKDLASNPRHLKNFGKS
jgi:hypothetical protein